MLMMPVRDSSSNWHMVYEILCVVTGVSSFGQNSGSPRLVVRCAILSASICSMKEFALDSGLVFSIELCLLCTQNKQ